MFDVAVFAGGVHGLKDNQHRPTVLRIELVLQLGKRRDARGKSLLGARLILGREVERVSGITIFETKILTVRDTEGMRQFSGSLDDFLHFHRCISSMSALPALVR